MGLQVDLYPEATHPRSTGPGVMPNADRARLRAERLRGAAGVTVTMSEEPGLLRVKLGAAANREAHWTVRFANRPEGTGAHE